jgi:hypothetical protein
MTEPRATRTPWLAIARTATLKGGLGYVWSFDDPDEQMVVEDPNASLHLPVRTPLFDLELASQVRVLDRQPHGGAGELHRAQRPGTVAAVQPGRDRRVHRRPERSGQEIIFERIPSSGGWSGEHFDRVITARSRVSTRRQLLEQGEADIVWAGTADDTHRPRRGPRFVVTDAPTLVMEYVALGSYGPLEDRAHDRR